MDDWKKGKFIAAKQPGEGILLLSVRCVWSFNKFSVSNEKIEEDSECLSMATNLILPSSFPSYQPERNEMVCINYIKFKHSWDFMYYKQTDIATGTLGLKPLTIGSINNVDLMELRVSLRTNLMKNYPLLITLWYRFHSNLNC